MGCWRSIVDPVGGVRLWCARQDPPAGAAEVVSCTIPPSEPKPLQATPQVDHRPVVPAPGADRRNTALVQSFGHRVVRRDAFALQRRDRSGHGLREGVGPRPSGRSTAPASFHRWLAARHVSPPAASATSATVRAISADRTENRPRRKAGALFRSPPYLGIGMRGHQLGQRAARDRKATCGPHSGRCYHRTRLPTHAHPPHGVPDDGWRPVETHRQSRRADRHELTPWLVFELTRSLAKAPPSLQA